MCELSHIICFVELRGIDFIDTIPIYFTLLFFAIVSAVSKMGDDVLHFRPRIVREYDCHPVPQ
jgi:hypothetical protein